MKKINSMDFDLRKLSSIEITYAVSIVNASESNPIWNDDLGNI